MNKKVTMFALIAAVAIPLTPALAETNTTTTTQDQIEARRQEMQQRKLLIQENRTAAKEQIRLAKDELNKQRLEFQNSKEKMTEAKCKNIETRISTRIQRYENNGQMFQTVYGNMQARLARLVERLKTAGADTTKLESDIATLNTKIEKLKSDQSSFMTTLKDSQSFACGNSEGEFKTKIDAARQIPETLRQDREDIRNFFQTTVKADLQTIRQTLTQQNQTTTGASTNQQ